MNILNISFRSINATKKSVPKGKIGIKNNVKITSLEEANMGLDKAKTTMKAGFQYKTEYAPDFAEIVLEGDVYMLEEAKPAKAALDKWKKDKGIDKVFAALILNNLMTKCTIQTIIIARELGLPSPVPMPRIKPDQAAAK